MTVSETETPFGDTDDFGNPGGYYFSRSQNGTNGMGSYNPYLMLQTTAETVKFRRFASGSWSGYRYTNMVIPSSPAPPWSTLEAKALSKLWSVLKGTDFNAAKFVAEARPATEMIASTALKIMRAWSAARKGDLFSASFILTGNGRGPRGKIASNWLELQYGWLPLLRDVKDAVDYIQPKTIKGPRSQFRARNTQKISNPNLSVHTYVWATADIKFGVEYGVTMDSDYQVSTADFSGLTDPASVAWELVPYSFVIDWFLPIGPWLEASFAARTMRVSRWYRTRFAHWRIHTGRPKAGQVLDPSPVGHYTERFYVSRAAGTSSLQTPGLPSFSPLTADFSVQRALNALALLSRVAR